MLVATRKLSRPVGVFVVVVLVELEAVLVVSGDVRMKLPKRVWDGSMMKETLIDTAEFTLPIFSVSRNRSILFAILLVFLVP